MNLSIYARTVPHALLRNIHVISCIIPTLLNNWITLSNDKIQCMHLAWYPPWHELLHVGHCNFEELIKSHEVVNGMYISGKLDKSKLECNTCTEGKFVNNRIRKPDARATKPLEIVHTNLAGPISPMSKEDFKYSIAFTDDFSEAVFVYFLENRNYKYCASDREVPSRLFSIWPSYM